MAIVISRFIGEESLPEERMSEINLAEQPEVRRIVGACLRREMEAADELVPAVRRAEEREAAR